MPTNFSVKTQNAAYVDGYQNGMRDIAEALQRGGTAAVEQWLKDNFTAATPAELERLA